MNEQDIAPGLLEELRRLFLELLGEGPLTADDWPGAYAAAERIGDALAGAFGQGLRGEILPDGRLYWNIADRVVRPLLEEEHALSAGAAGAAQQALNAAAGLGLRAVAAPVDSDRIDGLLNRLAAAQRYDDVAWLLDEPVRLLARAAVDETVRRNVEFQAGAGLRPRVVRTAEPGACKWCRALAGSYDYPDVPKDVYRRHENCRCRVEFDPRDGRRQDVWGKQWTEQQDRGILETRKTIGLLPADSPELAALKKEMTVQMQQLPAELQEALRQYTGFTGTRINNAIGQNRVTPAIQRQIELLDRALANGRMPERTVLYRRTSSSFLGMDLPKEPSPELLESLCRPVIVNNIFTSTSFRDLHLPGRNVLIELTVPEGYEGCLYLPSVAYPKFKNQDEVLFARGLRYKVMEIRFENGEYTIRAEVQP